MTAAERVAHARVCRARAVERPRGRAPGRAQPRWRWRQLVAGQRLDALRRRAQLLQLGVAPPQRRHLLSRLLLLGELRDGGRGLVRRAGSLEERLPAAHHRDARVTKPAVHRARHVHVARRRDPDEVSEHLISRCLRFSRYLIGSCSRFAGLGDDGLSQGPPAKRAGRPTGVISCAEAHQQQRHWAKGTARRAAKRI